MATVSNPSSLVSHGGVVFGAANNGQFLYHTTGIVYEETIFVPFLIGATTSSVPQLPSPLCASSLLLYFPNLHWLINNRINNGTLVYIGVCLFFIDHFCLKIKVMVIDEFQTSFKKKMHKGASAIPSFTKISLVLAEQGNHLTVWMSDSQLCF